MRVGVFVAGRDVFVLVGVREGVRVGVLVPASAGLNNLPPLALPNTQFSQKPPTSVGVLVAVGVALAVGDSVAVSVGVSDSVFVADTVGVAVTVGDSVAVGVGVSVTLVVAVGLAVAVEVLVGVTVGVGVVPVGGCCKYSTTCWRLPTASKV